MSKEDNLSREKLYFTDKKVMNYLYVGLDLLITDEFKIHLGKYDLSLIISQINIK